MAGHPDLRFAAKFLARIADIAIALPQMHAIGAEPLGQRDIVIDDEGHVAGRADRLQRFGQPRSFVLVDILDAELEGGDQSGPGIQRALETLGKVARHIERRD